MTTTEPAFTLTPSRQFPDWLAEAGLSLAVSTYQAGKLFLIGVQPTGRLSIFERTLNRVMGLAPSSASGPGTLFATTLFQIWRFENVLPPGAEQDGYDRVYTPRAGWVTGDLDIHDMAVDAAGRLVFVNTLFSCLATVSAGASFAPLWQPPFISKLAAEDRCHLNGLALRDGVPAFVTAVAASDVADGWRDHRQDGGIVIDVASGETIAGGLSMPHSPRWHDGRLYLLNSGSGEFGTLDLADGRFTPICFCPGYLRGLAFAGPFAVLGLSEQRENRTFSGLPLDAALAARNATPRCGVHVVDLRTGDVVHWLRIEGVIRELYDVAALPGVRRPSLIGFKTDEIRRVINIDDPQPLAP